MKRLMLSVILACGLLWLSSLPLNAVQDSDGYTIYYVAPGGNCAAGVTPCYNSVQAAVDAADRPGDEIHVAAGVYSGVQARAGLTQVVYLNKTIAIRGGYSAAFSAPPDPAANPTTLDAGGQGKVVYITGDISPTIEGLRITGGQGAGVYIVSATVVISHNQVLSNTGYGLYLHSSHATLDDNLVAHNTNSGLYLDYSPAVLSRNTFAFNKTGDHGGGLYLYHSPSTLKGNAIMSNTTHHFGGGLFLSYSPATLEGNSVTFNKASYQGGGLELYTSPSVLVGNTVANNRANYYGGGIYLDDSDTLLKMNTIYNNAVTAACHYYCNNEVCCGGGGIYVESGDVTLDSNTISANRVSTGRGGGLYLATKGLARLDSNTIAGNRASTHGGGVYRGKIMRNNVITNNVAGANGGGIYSGGALDGNVVTHNTAGRSGGGVYGSGEWRNNVIAENRAGRSGDGLYISAASRLLHNTIARNDGDGVYVGSGPVAMTNTILVSNSVGVTVTAGHTATLEATLWGEGDWSNGLDWGGAGAVATGTVNIWDDPGFADADQGDYHLASFSAALDAGTPAGVKWDMDGQPRPMDSEYDIGADEYPGAGLSLVVQPSAGFVNRGQALTYTLVVSSAGAKIAAAVALTDTLDGRQYPVAVAASVGQCALIQAWGGGAVCTLGALPPGTQAVITLTVYLSPALTLGQTITHAVVAAAAETASDAAVVNTVHDCHVRLNDNLREYASIQAGVDVAAPGDLVKVAGVCLGGSTPDGRGAQVYVDKNLTIRGGYTTTSAAPETGWAAPDPLANPTTLDAQGGGRVLHAAGDIQLALEGLRITGGDAGEKPQPPWFYRYDYGGGIYAVGAALTLSRCTLLHNIAGQGSALFAAGGAVTLTDNVIAANDACFGGAVSLDNSVAVFRHNTIISNTSITIGGVFAFFSTATFEDNIILANAGSGVRLDASTATLAGNIISANIGVVGGGVWLYASDATLISNTLASNEASWRGGGVYLGEYFVKGYAGAAINFKPIPLDQHALPDEKLTLIDNVIMANTSSEYGGGVYIDSGSANLSHNTILSNTAMEGGGVGHYGGDITLVDNTISFNNAGYGGGARLEYDGKATSNTITHNTAEEGGGVWDGGILAGNTIAYNTADNGGGVHGASTLIGNTIRDNIAHNDGGGVWHGWKDTLIGNTIRDNIAHNDGGGVWHGWEGTLTGNTITGNIADGNGGGVYGQGALTNNIVAGNRAGRAGGGLYLTGSSRLAHNTLACNCGDGIYVEAGLITLANTILVSHSLGLTVTAGHTATLEGTLWGAGEWANLADWGGAGTVLSGTHNVWNAPDFVAPQAGDYHLSYTSPAIDAGLDAGVTDDIDGDVRPVGDGYDLGADEFQPVLALEVIKRVAPNPAQPGQALTYTIYVTNAGNLPLHAAVTDTLPVQITSGATPGGTAFLPGGVITWAAISLPPGHAWSQSVVVTSQVDYVGPLVNVVQASAEEGASGIYTATSFVRLPNTTAYLPMVLRGSP